MNTALMKNRYIPPKNISHLAVANPNPAVQIGGIKAVAIATPGIAAAAFVLEPATIPATPPKNATPTSSIVGFVLAKISDVVFPRGVI